MFIFVLKREKPQQQRRDCGRRNGDGNSSGSSRRGSANSVEESYTPREDGDGQVNVNVVSLVCDSAMYGL